MLYVYLEVEYNNEYLFSSTLRHYKGFISSKLLLKVISINA